MTRKDAKVMLTNDTDYSCHIQPYNLFNQSYGVYITPLVINSLGGSVYTDICGQKQLWETRHTPGLNILHL